MFSSKGALLAVIVQTATAVRNRNSDQSEQGIPIQSHPDVDCDKEVGEGRLSRYTEDAREFCQSSGGESSFSCSAAKWDSFIANQEASAGDYACHGNNMRITLEAGKPVQLNGACTWALPKDGLKLKYFIFSEDTVPLELSDQESTCDETVTGTVLLYSEKELWNPYISQAQSINAFATIQALSIDPSTMRLAYTQNSSDRPMKHLLAGAFSKGGDPFEPTQEKKTICAGKVVVPAGGHDAWIRKDAAFQSSWAQTCNNAPLIQGYSMFIREAFQVQSSPSSNVERVLILTRDSNNVHPGDYKRHMTNADELKEVIENGSALMDSVIEMDADLEAELMMTKLLAQKLRAQGVQVTEVQPELFTIAEQATHFANADIVISAHSAALSWMYMMPTCAQVLEFCTGGDFQFVNYAQLAGKDHVCMHGLTAGWGTDSFEADVDYVLGVVNEAGERWETCTDGGVSAAPSSA